MDPLRRLLVRLADRVDVASIDELWIFPPRRFDRGESRLAVAAVFTDHDRDRRRVFTAHYVARTDDKGRLDVRSTIADQAVAPVDRIAPVVEGVLRRLDDDAVGAPPQTFAIDGDRDRWNRLLASLSPADDDGPSDAGAPAGVANPPPVRYQ